MLGVLLLLCLQSLLSYGVPFLLNFGKDNKNYSVFSMANKILKKMKPKDQPFKVDT